MVKSRYHMSWQHYMNKYILVAIRLHLMTTCDWTVCFVLNWLHCAAINHCFLDILSDQDKDETS